MRKGMVASLAKGRIFVELRLLPGARKYVRPALRLTSSLRNAYYVRWTNATRTAQNPARRARECRCDRHWIDIDRPL